MGVAPVQIRMFSIIVWGRVSLRQGRQSRPVCIIGLLWVFGRNIVRRLL